MMQGPIDLVITSGGEKTYVMFQPLLVHYKAELNIVPAEVQSSLREVVPSSPSRSLSLTVRSLLVVRSLRIFLLRSAGGMAHCPRMSR